MAAPQESVYDMRFQRLKDISVGKAFQIFSNVDLTTYFIMRSSSILHQYVHSMLIDIRIAIVV